MMTIHEHRFIGNYASVSMNVKYVNKYLYDIDSVCLHVMRVYSYSSKGAINGNRARKAGVSNLEQNVVSSRHRSN